MYTLDSLVSEIERIMPTIDFEAELQRFQWSPNIEWDLRNVPYYRALAAYCKLFSPPVVLEIGTCSGASAVAMAKHAGAVFTMDTDLSKVCDPKIFSENIQGMEVGPQDCLAYNYGNYDLIYVDIDHLGLMERLIHQRLATGLYKGYVFWDDVQMNDAMKAFWDSIEHDKILTDWHFTSFGIVEY